MKQNEKAREVLMKEVVRLGGIIFSTIWIRNYGNKEVQKQLESADMITNLMSGKGFKAEWKLEEMEEYKDLREIVESLYKLIPDDEVTNNL